VGLLTAIFGLPLAPVRGVVAIAQALEEQAEHELDDRGRIRRELEDAEMALRSGELTADEADRAHRDILRPLVSKQAPAPGAGTRPERG
jgi:gas vesicle protein GvpG